MHIENNKIVMGKMEKVLNGFLFINVIANIIGGYAPMTVAIIGLFIASATLTYRYIKNHHHNH